MVKWRVPPPPRPLPFLETFSVDVRSKPARCYFGSRYRQENPRSSQATANIRKLLGYLAEVRIRYKLATDMNFQDMASSILETNAYLKDILVP